MDLDPKGLEAAALALNNEHKAMWPGSWPARPEAIRLAQSAIIAYLSAAPAPDIDLDYLKAAVDRGADDDPAFVRAAWAWIDAKGGRP